MLKNIKIKTSTALLWHLVVHLFRAVKNIHHDTQRASQVFGGFRLPSASWPRGGAAHSQVEGLSQGYVTPAEAGNLITLRNQPCGESAFSTLTPQFYQKMANAALLINNWCRTFR